jgi:fermentation-respiration switch protein FrsA (DUF1100 family)
MIEIETDRLADISVLCAAPAGQTNRPLPTLIFYHGFTSSKLVYSYFAVALAQEGFRVVMPDAVEHGERFSGDAEGRLGRFWQILLRNFEEFPALAAELEDRGLVAEGRLGVGGASMGGMTALGLLARHPQLRCGASLMGSGYYMTLPHTLFPPVGNVERAIAALAAYDVGHQLASLATRPLLLWHGEEDDVVPAVETLRLQRALIQQGLDGNLRCEWQQGVRHRITPEALACTVDFFGQHL